MTLSVILALLFIGMMLSLALSFFFSGAETAVISANRFRLRSLHEQGDTRAGRLLGLLENTQRLLVMILIGNNLFNVLVALFFSELIERAWPGSATTLIWGGIPVSGLLGLAVLTPVVVVFAELTPKALCRAHADPVLPAIRPLILFFLAVLKPLIAVVERFTHLVLTPLSEQRSSAMRQVTRQDVLNLIAGDEENGHGEEKEKEKEKESAAGEEKEPLGATLALLRQGEEESVEEAGDERRMIHSIISLQETLARDIMTPLAELVAVRLGSMSVEGFKSLARTSGYSRYPVFRDRIVNLVGFIDLYRILREAEAGRPLEAFVEEAHYVPETKRVDDLLQEFLALRINNAIVVDEFGGCIGWISREDILEEIVGELEDELDEPGPRIQERPDGSFLIDARTEIDVLNEELGTEFEDEEWDTLAGLLLSELGRIPKPGDQVTLQGWRAEILSMDRHRIVQARLRRVE